MNMKKISTIFTLLVMLFAGEALAQYTGEGYYRVKNEGSSRYIVLRNDTVPNINSDGLMEGTFDAIAMVGNLDTVLFDAGSVIKAKPLSDGGLDLSAQGVGTYEITRDLLSKMDMGDEGLSIIVTEVSTDAAGTPLYNASAKFMGFTAYMQDNNGGSSYILSPDFDLAMSGNDATTRWYVEPVNAENNYYTPKPMDDGAYVTDSTYNYATLYVDFPVLLPEGAEAYIFVDAEKDSVNCKLVAAAGQLLPAKTPVILRWAAGTTLKLLPMDATETITEVTIPEGNLLFWCGRYFGQNSTVDPTAYRDLMAEAGEDGMVIKFAKPFDTFYGNAAYLSSDVENTELVFVAKQKVIETGDVNADGEVNIADVNALISIILGNSTEDDYAGVADVNGDAEINIADVNAVIAIILGN